MQAAAASRSPTPGRLGPSPDLRGLERPFGAEPSEDGTTISGAWMYPGGGGYESTSTRVER
jgi:hypothetical protein